ncbi:uncharacterized protein LOC114290642 [Camellia sinensis]|uniref:uncharacterized protein LOC114290642 n=1 Tax=Camellia sinensis TaxID=4442 RepID=UPI001036E0A8|nr:uncharacterized protein LOC114290642 [Camellia sinensis]
MARYHILLEGPICRAWFLSEPFVRQTLSLPAPYILMAPPASIRETHRLSEDEVIEFMVGLDADHFLMEGDYVTFIQMHLMPPLTGVRGGEGARAPAARRRGRAIISRRRRDPEARQETGWPELPTTVSYRTRSGETCQIPIEPAPAGRALVGIRGPTPAPIEYTGQALEVVASLTDMVQTSLDLLSLYWISIIFNLHFNATHESGPSEPVLGDDDETSEEAEAASRQSESSDGGDSDAGSNSTDSEAGEAEEGSDSGSDPALDSGADGGDAPESAQPKKRTKRASESLSSVAPI